MKTKQLIVDEKICSYTHSDLFDAKDCTLFLHGRQQSALSFEELFTLYDKDGKSRISIDFPGFGGSTKPDDERGVKEYAEFVKQFIDAKKIQPKVVVGHSFGGRIMLGLSYYGFMSAEKLVFIGSGGIQEYGGAWYLPILKIGKFFLNALGLKKIMSILQSKVRSSDYQSAGPMSSIFLNIIREDLQYMMGSVCVPSLLVWGEKDIVTPLRHAKIFHTAISESTLEVVAGMDHFVHVESPEVVYSLIKSFE